MWKIHGRRFDSAHLHHKTKSPPKRWAFSLWPSALQVPHRHAIVDFNRLAVQLADARDAIRAHGRESRGNVAIEDEVTGARRAKRSWKADEREAAEAEAPVARL